MCVRLCTSTSQSNLLKIYVHPALPPPDPPQALNVPSSSVSYLFASHLSCRFLDFLQILASCCRSDECSFVAEVGWMQGEEEGRKEAKPEFSRWKWKGQMSHFRPLLGARCSASHIKSSGCHDVSAEFPLRGFALR